MEAGHPSGARVLMRGLAARLAMVLGSVLVIEGLSLIVLMVLSGDLGAISETSRLRRAVLESEEQVAVFEDDRPVRIREGMEVLHPYLGYVLDPGRAEPGEVHELGFHDLDEVMEPAREDRVIVAIFGGSVAGQVWEGRAPIEQTLAEVPALEGKEIHVIRVALGGYKQPQQVMALQYLLALGGHLDIVVCVDGFNEVVLPWQENARNGVAPFYPRSWYWRTGNVSDSELLRRAGRMAVLQDLRHSAAEMAAGAWARWSPSVNLVWLHVDRLIQGKLLDARQGEADPGGEVSDHPYQRAGPFQERPRDQVLRASAELWARAAVDMNALAKEHGIVFLQVLQPNQYYEGSKPLTAREKREAIQLDRGYGSAARDGYPYLVQAGRQVAGAGVPYLDATMLFEHEERTLYVDTCCHLNELGMQLLAEEIAERLVELVEGAAADGQLAGR